MSNTTSQHVTTCVSTNSNSVWRDVDSASRINEMFRGQVLAIDPGWWSRMSGAALTTTFIPESRNQLDHPKSRTGRVAVLPIHGPIAQERDMMMSIFGGTSTDEFGRVFDQVIAAKGIDHVVLDIRSPGGSVYGVQELADKIHAGRQTKNVFAVANSYAFSAAYWLGSQASEFSVTPSGEVGSVGVIAVHQDDSGLYEANGVKHTVIKAGKHKGTGNPYEPLSDEDRQAFQESVDGYYENFTSAVARGRGVTQSAVKAGFGQGRGVGAERAVADGMVDKVQTLDQVLGSLGVQTTGSGMRASDDGPGLYEQRARLAEMEA